VIARLAHPCYVVGVSLGEFVPLTQAHDGRPWCIVVGELPVGDRPLPAQPQSAGHIVGKWNLVDPAVLLPLAQPLVAHWVWSSSRQA
jgi:hypothetical protein